MYPIRTDNSIKSSKQEGPAGGTFLFAGVSGDVVRREDF